MPSLILTISSRYISTVLLLLSLAALWRGHNLPGGGFAGGLIAASAILILALAYGWEKVETRLPIQPLALMIIGLAVAIGSGFVSPVIGGEFMKGVWLPRFDLPLLGKVKLGTPLLFDVGVYLTVIGFTLKCAHALGTEGDD